MYYNHSSTKHYLFFQSPCQTNWWLVTPSTVRHSATRAQIYLFRYLKIAEHFYLIHSTIKYPKLRKTPRIVATTVVYTLLTTCTGPLTVRGPLYLIVTDTRLNFKNHIEYRNMTRYFRSNKFQINGTNLNNISIFFN